MRLVQTIKRRRRPSPPRTGDIVPAEDGICQGSAQGAPAPVSDPVHREVLALVRQQLDVLETRQITWQGEAWPGQIVSLEILEEEKGAHGQSGGSDEASILPWKTCLRLTLPSLGTITANLRLNVHGLALQLAAHDSSAGDTLRSGMAVLGRALESSGITLLSVSVDVDEKEKGDRREAAVALAYRAGQLAPRIVAKGNGLVAEAIIRQAQAHGIYVHESPALVSLLMQVDLDQHIPPQLYRAVAELLAWLYQMETRPENSTAQLELARDKHNGSTSNQDR